MCYQLVELYSACRCLYYQHAVDRCAGYGRPGHSIQQRTIFVGYACKRPAAVLAIHILRFGLPQQPLISKLPPLPMKSAVFGDGLLLLALS
ncbi:hypothetical protein HYQ46_004043 [Verticillium longisporum]|nr:hypothetical protein HYQ46_004043 [Verticillium longisporum]